MIAELPPSDFASGGQPRAFASNLEQIEQLVLAGELEAATGELRDLRRRVDGCAGGAGRPDRNDWIVDCESQLAVRAVLDALIASLASTA